MSSNDSLDGNLPTIADMAPRGYLHLAPQHVVSSSQNPSSAIPAVARVEQDPANYSQSQEGTSIANSGNSHIPYHVRIRTAHLRQRENVYVSYRVLHSSD
jgi:hypothetical protein